MTDESRAERARRRRGWPVVKLAVGEAGATNLVGSTSMEARLGMMWRLAVDAWASMGEPIPSYNRAEAPGRVVRPSEDP